MPAPFGTCAPREGGCATPDSDGDGDRVVDSTGSNTDRSGTTNHGTVRDDAGRNHAGGDRVDSINAARP